VGHTDNTGDPDVNDPLSLNRARSIKAYLTDDVEAWLDFYGDHMHANARWGPNEDHLMLDAVLAATGEAVTDTPVRHFQATRGLEPDNKLGDNTRRSIITEYMAADGTTLPKSIEPVVHGCGANFPLALDDPPDHTHDRRVELYFFDPHLGILPPPPGDLSAPDTPEYPEWRRRAQETHDYRIRQLPTIELLVVDEAGRTLSDVAYRLTLFDGRVLEGTCAPDGLAKLVGIATGASQLELSDVRLRRPGPHVSEPQHPRDTPQASAIEVRVRLRADGTTTPVELPPANAYRVVVERPKAHLLEVGNSCFHTDRVVFLPDVDPLPDDEPGPARLPGLTLAAMTLTFVDERPEKRLFVAGHADRAGSAGHNRKLSEARAENVMLFLAGDREGWAQHALEHHAVDDVQRILKWIAHHHPDADCDPGDVDNDLGSETQTALDNFRRHFGDRHDSATAELGSSPQIEDWNAFAVSYDEALAARLELTLDELVARKRALTFEDPPFAGFGENFPLEAPQVDGLASEYNRRVEILFLDPEESIDLQASDPQGAHIFGAEAIFRLLPLDSASIRRSDQIAIRVLDLQGRPLKGERLCLLLPDGSEIEGVLDDRGTFSRAGLTPGTCGLTLVDLDARSWPSVSREPGELPELDDTDEDQVLDDEVELPGLEPPETFDDGIPDEVET
jgi:hypothetical protein